jgi:hypothetical protein
MTTPKRFFGSKTRSLVKPGLHAAVPNYFRVVGKSHGPAKVPAKAVAGVPAVTSLLTPGHLGKRFRLDQKTVLRRESQNRARSSAVESNPPPGTL